MSRVFVYRSVDVCLPVASVGLIGGASINAVPILNIDARRHRSDDRPGHPRASHRIPPLLKVCLETIDTRKGLKSCVAAC